MKFALFLLSLSITMTAHAQTAQAQFPADYSPSGNPPGVTKSPSQDVAPVYPTEAPVPNDRKNTIQSNLRTLTDKERRDLIALLASDDESATPKVEEYFKRLDVKSAEEMKLLQETLEPLPFSTKPAPQKK